MTDKAVYVVDTNGSMLKKRLQESGDGYHSEVVAIDDARAEIIDQSSATYHYHCQAAPGTLSSAASWRISRLTVATGVVQWADGNANYDNVADNRASLTYS